MEPRIILGSCLALGGAEALLGNAAEAAERDNPAVTAPPAEIQNPNSIKSLPTTEIPTLLSWKPSISDLEAFAKNSLAKKQPAKNWLNQSNGGGGLSDKLKDVPKAAGNKFKSQAANGGYNKLASPINQAALAPGQAATASSLFTGAKSATSPQVTIQSINSGNYINTGSTNAPGSIVVNTGTDSMVLRATGSFTALSGADYTLSLSASGPGSNTIIDWTIDWGDGTVETIDGNPDQASHVYAEEGAYIIKTSVSDGENTWSSSTVPVQVVNAAQPDFVSNPPTDAGIGQDWQYKAKAVRPDNGQVSYSLVSGPQGMIIDANTGLLSWNPGAEYAGQHTIVIEALGEQGKTARQELLLTVHEELQSRPPQIVSGPPANISADVEYSFQVEAWDPDGNTLTFYLDNAPAGLTISQEGLINWVPSEDMNGQNLTVTLRVEDGRGGVATQAFNLTARNYQSPAIKSTPSQYAVVGKEYSYQIAAESSDGATLTYTLEKGPVGMSIDPATGFVSYIPSEAGDHTVEIQISDGRSIESQTFTLRMVVSPVPQIVSTPTQSAYLGQKYEYQAEVINPDAEPVSWRLENPIQGLSISESTGRLVFNPVLTGAAAVTIIARDQAGQEVRQSFEILVHDQTAPQAPVIHSQMRSTVPVGMNYIHQILATDPTGEPLAYSLVQGPAGAYMAENGQLSWSPTSDQLGQHTITVRATNETGVYTEAIYEVTVGEDYVNQAPVFCSSPPPLASVSQGWTYRASTLDSDSDSVYFTIEQGPQGMIVDHVSGLFRWQPTSDQLGEHQVMVGAVDAYGAWTIQTFTLTVQEAAAPLRITSTPTTIGKVDGTWIYQAVAENGTGGEYTFFLGDNAPACMQLDSKTGLLAFTPDAPGDYVIDLFVMDEQGNVSGQQFITSFIAPRSGNLPPQLNSDPLQYAAVGKDYVYQVSASDPNGGSLSYSLLNAPTGMEIDAQGRLTWHPADGDVGEYRVEIVISNGTNSIMQSFMLTAAYNAAPVFDRIADQVVTGGTELIIDAAAKDANNHQLFYEIVDGPAGLTVDQNGILRWSTSAADSGSSSRVYRVELRAVDPFGEEARVSFNINVTKDLTPPEVSLTSSKQPANLNDVVSFFVSATDNLGVTSMSLTVDGSAVALDAAGMATVAFSTAGEHIIRAEAHDAAGNIGFKEMVLRVANPADNRGPTLSWNVANKAVITDPFEIRGSASDESGFTWTLSLKNLDSNAYQVFADGDRSVQSGVFAVLDPISWANGTYMLSLDAVDSNGNTSRQAALITINSQYKMGNFNLTFDDLSVGVGGIPITIKRTYDSLKSNISGDFGYGWSMSYIPVSLRDNSGYSLAGDWFDSLYSDAGFRNGTKITVTLPDGKTAIFRVNAVKSSPFLPYYKINFVDESGSGTTLSLDRNVSLMIGSDGILTDTARAAFHPSSSWTPANYILTTADGTKYYIGGGSGECYQAVDTKNNKVEIGNNTIRSYSGSLLVGEVTFQRDSRGRIIEINNINGDNVTYEYDLNGDLAAVNNSTLTSGRVELKYIDDPKAPLHYFESVVDARGVAMLTVEYDFVNGRIKGITGPDGSFTSLGFSQSVGPGLHVESVTDQLGRTSETVVDRDGNAVRSLVNIPDPTDPDNPEKMTYQITIREFDAKDNCLAVSRTFQVTERELLLSGWNQYNYLPADLLWEERATYDNKGNRLTSTDIYGQITRYTYDSAGYLLSTTDPFGRVSTNKYDSYGRCLESVDFSGNKIVYTYDGGGRLASYKMVKPDGSAELQTFEYNGQSKMTKMEDDKGNVTRYAYNAKGWKLYSVTEMPDPQDSSLTHTITEFFEYDEAGNEIETWREIDGVEVSHTERRYDAIGQLTGTTDKYGLTTEYIYDLNGQELEIRRQVKDSNGQISYLVSRNVYDAAGQLIWEQAEHLETDPVNSPQAAEATYISYDLLGRETRSETRTGVLIKLAGSGYNLKTVVMATGSVVSYSAQGYDQHGQEAWSENANGVKTLNFYTPEGALSHTMMDLDGNLATTYDQFTTQKALYDAYGRQIQVIVDRDGNLDTTIDQIAISHEYDNHGRILKTTYADGTFTAYTYDLVGRKTSETDQMGRTTHYEYDQAGRLTAAVLPQVRHPQSGQMVHVRYEYAYNVAGQQVGLKDNLFQTDPLNSGTIDRSSQRDTTFTYDWQGRQIARSLPDGSTEHFHYDQAGRKTGHASFEGRITVFEYDALDRVSRVVFFNNAAEQGLGLAAKTIDYTYDHFNRVVQEVDSANGTTRSTYNAAGQISRLDSPQGVLNYEYDAVTGQVTRTWTGTNSAQPITDVRNTYDNQGRLETVSTFSREGAILSTPETARYVYDLIGNLDKIVQANGVISDYEYDQFYRLIKLTHYAPDATPENLSDNPVLQRFVYDYYNDGQRSHEIFTDAQGQTHTWNWVYDQIGRLIEEIHDNADNSQDYATEYVYDLVGNRLEKREDLGNDGSIDKVTTGIFDQNDRLISETEQQNGQAAKRTDYIYRQTEQIAKTVIDLINNRTETNTTMEYSAQGRLSKITIDTYVNGVKAQSVIQDYIYDSGGLKIRQVESVDANADGVIDSQNVTDYLNEGLNHTGYSQVLEEKRLENGQLVKTTTYTLGDDVLSQFDALNGYLALLTDIHGSTRGVANRLGQIVQQYSYDAYGNALGFDPGQAKTSLLYSGEQFNPVSGLQYLRARWYSPNSGRFNRLDPFVGNQDTPLSFHNYAYGNMNPITHVDPSGNLGLVEVLSVLNIIGQLSSIASFYYMGKNIFGKAQDLFAILQAASILRDASEYDPIGALVFQKELIIYALDSLKDMASQAVAGMSLGALGFNVGSMALVTANTIKFSSLLGKSTNLTPYNKGGGHHIFSQKAFEKDPNYSKWRAPCVTDQQLLDAAGIRHKSLNGPQRRSWDKFASQKRLPSLEEVRMVEYRTLRSGGVDAKTAREWVDHAYGIHKALGWTPKSVPWHPNII